MFVKSFSTACVMAILISANAMPLQATDILRGSRGKPSSSRREAPREINQNQNQSVNQNVAVQVSNDNTNVNLNANINLNLALALNANLFLAIIIPDALTGAINKDVKSGTILPVGNEFHLVSDLSNPVGTITGHNIVLSKATGAKGKTYNSAWTFDFDGSGNLPQGSLMVSGTTSDFGVSKLAIVGGTEAFSGIKGYVEATPIFKDRSGNIADQVDANNKEGIDFSKTTYKYAFHAK